MSQRAVIKLQGHQYFVAEGARLRVDRMKGKEGAAFECKDVYCVFGDNLDALGTPTVKGASVTLALVRNTRGKKVITFKYRPKARSRVKKGFKPEYSEVVVKSIKAT